MSELARIPVLKASLRSQRSPLARAVERGLENRAALVADPLLPLKDAKAVLGVCEATLRRYVKLGVLPVQRYTPRGHLRVRMSALQALLKGGQP